MKKTLGLFGLLLLGGSVSFGANLTVNTSNAVQTNCNGGVFNESYYLGKTPTRYYYDIVGGDINKHYVIGMTSSSAAVYNPYGIFQFQGGVPTFAYKSEIKPRGIQEVISAHQNQGAGTDIVNHGTSRSAIAGQIVYSMSRKEESKGTQATTTTYRYMKTDKSTDSVSTNVNFNSSVTSDNECLNIYVGWCGDEILDNGSSLIINGQSTKPGELAGGEQCDNGALNGKDGKCSLECKTVTTAPYCGDGSINQASEQCDNGALNGKDGKCSATCTLITDPTGKLTLVKSLVTNKTYYSGDLVQWRIDFTNQGATDAINVVLQDELPMSLTYVDSTIFAVTAQKRTFYDIEGEFVVEYAGFTLKPGAAGYIILNAKVKGDRDYSNFRMNCALMGAKNFGDQSSCALYEYGTGTTPTENASCLNISTNVVNDKVNVVCAGKNTTPTTPMSVNCGNGILPGFADPHGFFATTCSYTSTDEAAKAKVSCAVANDTNNSNCISSPNACTIEGNSMVAIVGDDVDTDGKMKYTCSTKNGQSALLQIDCGNGNKSAAETDSKITYTCTYTEADYDNAGSDKTIQATCLVDGGAGSCKVDTTLDKGFIGYCGDGVRQGYEQCDAGGGTDGRGAGITSDGKKCLRGCTLCDKCNDEVTQCLSLGNGNTSVQSKELLPFWWRMYKPAYIIHNATCDDKSDNGNIDRSTMKCSFSLRQPKADAPVSFANGVDCSDTQLDNHALFSNFYKDYWKNAFGNWYVDLHTLLSSSKFDDNTFGEYKIRLHEVDYRYCACDDTGCGWKDTQINNICETDFTITRPYLVQKNAFGTSPKATDAKLTNFFDIIGNPLIDKTDLADVMVLDANTYNGGNDAKFMIVSEAGRIAKLAVTLANNKIPTALQGLNVKKVPNKAIYYIYSATHKKLALTPNAISTTTPFTIITKNIDLTIIGSLTVNGMFIAQDGTITFQQDADGCTAGPQVVRGIFVAGNGFASRSANGSDTIENSNLNLSWCKYGNLQVKGILIGDGVDTLVQERRSNLNNWFNVNGSERSIKVQRRNQIFNGASLLIEYSTDLWKQLPPGADQFVNLLDIYKK